MTEEDSFFQEEVQKDHRICNNCFRKCRDIFKPTHWLRPIKVQQNGKTVETVEVEPVRSSVPTTNRNLPILDQTEAANDRRVCKCGVFEPTTVMRDEAHSLTKDEALYVATRLADRVEEKASGFDRIRFYNLVREYKSDEGLSNQDDEIFKRAIERAI